MKDLSARLNIKPSTLYLWAAQGDSHLDVDRLIEAAKREVYTLGHGETITPSPTGKE